jgi:hypothetical protein
MGERDVGPKGETRKAVGFVRRDTDTGETPRRGEESSMNAVHERTKQSGMVPRSSRTGSHVERQRGMEHGVIGVRRRTR